VITPHSDEVRGRDLITADATDLALFRGLEIKDKAGNACFLLGLLGVSAKGIDDRFFVPAIVPEQGSGRVRVNGKDGGDVLDQRRHRRTQLIRINDLIPVDQGGGRGGGRGDREGGAPAVLPVGVAIFFLVPTPCAVVPVLLVPAPILVNVLLPFFAAAVHG
jgi:hypothetical protein